MVYGICQPLFLRLDDIRLLFVELKPIWLLEVRNCKEFIDNMDCFWLDENDAQEYNKYVELESDKNDMERNPY